MKLTNYQKQELKRILGKNCDLSISSEEAQKIIDDNPIKNKSSIHHGEWIETKWTKEIGVVVDKGPKKSVKTFFGRVIQISNSENHNFKEGDRVAFEYGNPNQHRVLARNLTNLDWYMCPILALVSTKVKDNKKTRGK